jgi:hypothetical protein
MRLLALLRTKTIKAAVQAPLQVEGHGFQYPWPVRFLLLTLLLHDRSSIIVSMNQLPLERRVQILSALTEGNSLRSTSRMGRVAVNTVVKMLVDSGTACAGCRAFAGSVRDRESGKATAKACEPPRGRHAFAVVASSVSPPTGSAKAWHPARTRGGDRILKPHPRRQND